MADVPDRVHTWVAAREQHRRNGDLSAADALRQRIAGAGYEVTDTPDGPVVAAARRWQPVAAGDVANRLDAEAEHDLSVLLLLDVYGLEAEPAWLVEDATRCLASVLEHLAPHRFEVCILDNGVGGAAGAWAADAARNPGISALHLGEPVGFNTARALQHRAAMGRVLLWLDTGVTLDGDVAGRLLDVFADPEVGLAGRWGADLSSSIYEFTAVEPPTTGLTDVHAVWGYLLGLRRELLRSGAVALDEGFDFYRNADAELSFRVRAAGARTVLADLPAVQHVHRGFTETPASTVERESRRNYQRLLERWRGEMRTLAAGR
ncbi:MAG: glycosyltransferase [Actinomycetota bacterium]|nr:glycosyltransferase [Actinomycetota bacterium]